MSGGHFDYAQYRIGDIASSIHEAIKGNSSKDQWGYARNYSPETLAQFQKAIDALEQAQIYAQRVDWLLSGDDSEECFHKRLADDLAQHIEKGA